MSHFKWPKMDFKLCVLEKNWKYTEDKLDGAVETDEK